MERLTEKHYLGTDHYMKCSGKCNVDMDCIDCPSFDCLVERLAAYEDTGLTPERCAEFARADAEGRYIVMRDAKQEGVARLRELAEADKEGRVVVLPCKVDDVLYRASPSGVVVHRVANVIYRGLTSRWYIDTIPNLPYASEELGKTAFLTHEEAKKALEAMKDA